MLPRRRRHINVFCIEIDEILVPIGRTSEPRMDFLKEAEGKPIIDVRHPSTEHVSKKVIPIRFPHPALLRCSLPSWLNNIPIRV